MNKKKILIPKEIKNLFNNDYLDIDLAIKLLNSDNSEIKKFLSELVPIIKEYLQKNFPIIKLLKII